MIDRIRALIKLKNLNAAQFADAIGVQRSSISHVLSGRNKPSLEFVQKILKTFPDINSDWLLSGTGELGKSFQEEEIPLYMSSKEENEEEKVGMMRPEAEKQSVQKSPEKRITPSITDESIEKVIIFYKNGSFKAYTPH